MEFEKAACDGVGAKYCAPTGLWLGDCEILDRKPSFCWFSVEFLALGAAENEYETKGEISFSLYCAWEMPWKRCNISKTMLKCREKLHCAFWKKLVLCIFEKFFACCAALACGRQDC